MAFRIPTNRVELLRVLSAKADVSQTKAAAVWDAMLALARDGVTILMTSHLLGDTEDVCTKIAILSKGQVAAFGRTDELLTRKQDARFTIAGLDEEQAKAFAAEASARFGREVQFDHPRVPLEEFFAETVGEGR